MKVWFFPGLGADASLGPFHALPGYETAWVEWPVRASRDWPEFLSGLQEANPIRAGDVFIGISFGGMAAQMLAGQLRPSGIILISSCRSSRSIAPSLACFRPILPCIPSALFDMRLLPSVVSKRYFGIADPSHVDLLYAMARRLPPKRFKEITELCLDFLGPSLPEVPIFSIHGLRDRLIPAGRENRDVLIPDGGHLISMTHSAIVNARLLGWLGMINNPAMRGPGS
ncbi:MAG: alpha/beta hydrolase [Fibrobacteres bacterium]|jgi:pimeloyl-ACP methyl ester carboxylesterase|nr:alpha/beta hydrolase [Fibrobacterota bacterium]